MKKETLSLKDALKILLTEHHEKPAISSFELTCYFYQLYQDKHLDDHPIRKLSLDEPSYRVMENNIDDLMYQGVITQHLNLPIYLINSQRKPSAQQYACIMNPCCYLAYISAMEWHGITDRIPNTIHLITCSNAKYKELMTAEVKNRLSKVNSPLRLISPRVLSIPNYDNKFFQFHQAKNFTLPKAMYGTGGVRVSSLGDTFLDMLKNPDLCGGFDHVLDVFKEYADEYLPIIVKAINKRGNSMDKARAGYILEEECDLSHRVIDSWKKGVQRGGSRKLVPNNPYKPIYSETWCITINK